VRLDLRGGLVHHAYMAFAQRVLWGLGGAAALMMLTAAGCGDDDCTRTLTCPTGSGGDGGSGGGMSTSTGDGGSTTSGMGGDMGAPNGTACMDGGECRSGVCADGVCCDAACDGSCESCALTGTEGACTPHPANEDPENECGLATCDGAGACQVGEQLWGYALGNASNQSVTAMAVDANGNIYVTGRFDGSVTIGNQTVNANGSDAFVAKLASTGNVDWLVKVGAADTQYPTHLVLGSSKVFVAGRYRGAMSFSNASTAFSDGLGWFIVGLDVNGNDPAILVGNEPNASTLPLFQTGVGAMTYSGSKLYAFTYTGALQTPTRTIRRYAGDGSSLESSQTIDHSVTVMARSGSGGFLAAGLLGGTGFSPFGGPALDTNGLSDIWVAEVDSNFNAAWAKSFGGNGNEYIETLVEVSGGEIIAAGRGQASFTAGDMLTHSGGSNDIFVVRLGSDGTPLGGTMFGGVGDDRVEAVAVDDDSIIVAGATDGALDIGGIMLPGDGDDDALVVKLDATTLAPVWARRAGVFDDQAATACVVDAQGRVTVGGTFDESVDFGGGPISTTGNDDGFLVQLSP